MKPIKYKAKISDMPTTTALLNMEYTLADPNIN
jgi:hypothetical protein